ncbi:A disintegrin and metalloproteinase with thrombospondin motifs 9-like [Haliotis rubra]|uniref:A disintegrin and metalloproteinase with thrombospondin motifs 9-like n=1 Tax=Haliotis rubra TaxID=36100 RepID=UPI001EE51964|nr:A disintegrin and metalloproteinase with thrombospondin motifs 9-like [Haliotis rubra]
MNRALLLFMLCKCLAASITSTHFKNRPEYNDMSVNGLLEEPNVLNRVHCGVLCLKNQCLAFIYNANTRVCRRSSSLPQAHEVDVPEVGARFYETGVPEETPPAANPHNCSDIKQCLPGATDGEYWIYSPTLGNKKVRIYCHNMSSVPSEYVTLFHTNKGDYPGVRDLDCDGEEPMTGGKAGVTSFSRVKVNAENMTVITDDYEFAFSTGTPSPYGQGLDCYTRHSGNVRNTCGPKGTFLIDTRGTGLLFSKNIQWQYKNPNSWGIAQRFHNGTVIEILGGGNCGGVKPAEDLQFETNTNEDLDAQSATSC